MATEKRYNMSAYEAHLQRATKQEILSEIEELETQRDGTKGKERGSFTKAINSAQKDIDAIDAELRDAPPAPVSPAFANEQSEKFWVEIIDTYEEAKGDFIDNLKNDQVNHVMKWHAEELIALDKQAKRAQAILSTVANMDHADAVYKLLEIRKKLVEELTDRVISLARYPNRHSNPGHCFVASAELAAEASLLDKLTRWESLQYFTSHLIPGMETWLELKHQAGLNIEEL